MMPITSEDGADLGAVLARQHADFVQIVVVVMQPARLGEAENDVVAGLRLIGHQVEVVALAVVEVVGELDVGAPDPPVVRQLDREVAAMLMAAPSAELRAYPCGDPISRGAEERAERDKAVIPVVVAGNGEELALRRVCGEGPVVGIAQAGLVFVLRGIRIDLVAAHDEKFAGGQRIVCACHLQFFFGQHVGHGEGRFKAVAEIGDVVDPHGARGIGLLARSEGLPVPL